ncbi:MAG: hypothetical protein LBU38_08040 [Propionibacteriaceae bacterium]|jgi:hypothetical protein|nr:hypothetical protein [Propionibacteriaceae bacterium]
MKLSIYGFIWWLLPGPKPVKFILALLLLAAVLVVLFQYVFPAVADYMPFNNVTVDE